MKYLTKIIVDKKIAIKQRLNDSYAWHKAMWEAFSNRPYKMREFLTRIDDKGTFFQVLLLSNERPTSTGWGRWETKEIPPHFWDYDIYRFQIRANATVKRVVRDESGERKKNGKRTAIYKKDELEGWINNKASKSGFELNALDIDPPVSQPFYKKGKAGKHAGVEFRGILKVIDKKKFIKSFYKGIGPAKAFGFGLLLLEPIK